MGCLTFEEDVAATGIRNLREAKNAERYLIRVRRWSIVPRKKKTREVFPYNSGFRAVILALKIAL